MLENVYFINGTAYAGKSTMVKLLSEKYNGIFCRENYHNDLLPEMDKNEYPNLTYVRDLVDWSDFVRRTPDQYEAWIRGSSREAEKVELQILAKLAGQGRKVFVDTNIRPETLHRISDENHVLIMLADPEISVRRFFERPDREKQFIYQLLMKEEDPEKALENFRQCLKRINSEKAYRDFLNCGFPVILRDENRTVEETLKLVEKVFRLA